MERWGNRRGRGLKMGQFALRKRLARIGKRYHGKRADIPGKGIFLQLICMP